MTTAPAEAVAHSPPKHSRTKTIVGLVITIAVLVGVFVFAIPRFTSYSDVLKELGELTWTEIGLMIVATVFNVITFWWINQAALPGLGFWQSGIVTQSSYALANTVPAGGPLSLGLTYEILKFYRFEVSDIVLMVGVGGIWNVLGKFVVPVLAVLLLLVTGEHSDGIVTAALVGVAALLLVFGILFLVLWKESLARAIGNLAGTVASWFLHLFHHRPVQGFGDQAVTFRAQTIGLIRRRWAVLTGAATLNQVSFFVVLLIALRGVGVGPDQVALAEAFAAFAFARLVSAIPITPGAVGTAEVAYTALLVAAGGNRAEVVAAVLLFRAFTYALPIPVGAVTYLVWRGQVRRRRKAGA